jgi:hypothetical protein
MFKYNLRYFPAEKGGNIHIYGWTPVYHKVFGNFQYTIRKYPVNDFPVIHFPELTSSILTAELPRLIFDKYFGTISGK